MRNAEFPRKCRIHAAECARGHAAGLLLFALISLAGQAFGQAGGWTVGADLKRQLATPVSVSWNNVPLWPALSRLSETQRLAIVLDRRIDPDQSVHLAGAAQPLSQLLTEVAERSGAAYCQLGPVAYLGPAVSCARLRTLAALRLADARSLSPAQSRKFLAMRSWQWDDLAEPRALAEQLAQEAEVELDGAERIPHDLWRGADLPPLSWIDRMTLLAAQFDLTFRTAQDGHRIKLVDVPADLRIERSYSAGRNGAETAKRWAKEIPSARIRIDKGQIHVLARVEDHEAIEARLRGKPLSAPMVVEGPQRYQLKVEKAALSKVLDELSGRLSLRIDWDRAAIEAAGIAADPLVSFDVQDVDLDGLLNAVLADTGLIFERRERVVVIRPAR